MAITKTNFINFTRCPRYTALEKIKKERLESEISFDDYDKELNEEKIKEILERMYSGEDEEEIDLVDVNDASLEAMMKYYKQVEIEAAKVIDKVFGGQTRFALNTRKQESYDYNHNGIRYICYLDIINENDNGINIIEVKATTSSGYLELGSRHPKATKYSIFTDVGGIARLKDELEYNIEAEMPVESYEKQRIKLFNRYGAGKYLYDLTVQRLIIEGEYQETNQQDKIKQTHYYLATLNHEYIFDGTYDGDNPVYNPDNMGNEIIKIFDFTKVTKEYLNIVKQDQEKLEQYLNTLNPNRVPVGIHCQYKKSSQCKYFDPVCASHLPTKNSVLNYAGRLIFDNSGKKSEKIELINLGYSNMLDVPEQLIKNQNHLLQRKVVESHQTHINKNKINDGIKNLTYPIYHLDFETFPCPLPRFKGETCYTQSPFEFSLHIEHSPGKCDFNQDNYVYLNKSHNDERSEIAKKLCELIDPNQGTIFAQNCSFEQSVMRKLSNQFPEYKDQLLKMIDITTDLIYIVKGNSELYSLLGYDEVEAKEFNYYHEDLNGSFSIKKTLPVFTNIDYSKLMVKNGVEAYVTYLKYPTYSEEEFKIHYQALIDYCKQDTWAMVEILDALRRVVE